MSVLMKDDRGIGGGAQKQYRFRWLRILLLSTALPLSSSLWSPPSSTPSTQKLNQFDITWDTLAKRHEGFTPSGAVVEDASKLTQDAEQIKFRKDMLSRYFARLLENPYDERMIKYLEYVARIHTDTPTKKSKINVDLIHINALLGYVEAVLIGGVKSLNLDRDTEYKAITAFGKLLWIQNDFFIKFYCRDGAEYLETSTTTTTTAVARSNQGFFSRLLRYFF
ncbi:MAG: Protoglobin-domain-containing protein [Benniella sp.]|nr:MAG: Protoglobin-domain-containing protein [Benniella sp.]KAK3813978.1 MAG: Protoglobin-domain-containing protein [Benniella sp.]